MYKTQCILFILVGIALSMPLNGQVKNNQSAPEEAIRGEYFFNLDAIALKRQLSTSGFAADRSPNQWMTIQLPDNLGRETEYLIAEDPSAIPEVYNAYPSNKTFKIIGKSDQHIHGVLTYSDKGFEGLILDHSAAIFIEPVVGNMHRSYTRSQDEMRSFRCGTLDLDIIEDRREENRTFKRGNDNSIRTYEMAVAAAGEFSNARSNNLTTINADLNYYVAVLNVFYEYELGIRFTRVTGNELVFTNPATDNITPGDPVTVHNAIIGIVPASNFDIGHGFGHLANGGSGIAYLGVVCSSSKGRGWSSASNNGSMVDIVLHEVGHQFGAYHSFYGNSSNCTNRSAGHGYEPGSGNSLMSYEGLCAANGTTCSVSHNITPQAGTYYFNIYSLHQIVSKITSTSCASVTNAGNDIPVMSMPTNKSIPKGTPFTLIGSATDADPLTYTWEEYDTDNNSVDCTTAHPDFAANSMTAPLFRSFDPSSSGHTRIFPKPSDLLGNVHTLGEILPQVARNLKMRLTARDGKGGTNWGETILSVVGTAGPFVVNTANTATTYTGGQSVTVTWNVANTTAPPISCAQVDILWSADGGYNFNTVLVSATSNDGSQAITIPNVGTTLGRLKIQAVGNYFFDVNDANITVTSGCQPKTTYLLNTTEVVAAAGDPSLNLSLGFGEKVTSFIGSLSSTPSGGNPIKASPSSSACTIYNSSIYTTKSFYVSTSGNYTFSLGNSTIFWLTLFNGPFNTSSVCTNYLNANCYPATPAGYYGTNTNWAVTANFNVSNQNTLRIGGSGSYNIVFSGPGDVLNAATAAGGFTYQYVIVKDGIIKGIASTANLSNAIIYSPGSYVVHGLYVSSSANLASYVGGSFSTLQSAIASGAICGALSNNSKSVIITGCVPSTTFVTSTSSNVNTAGSLPYVLANACTGDTILFNLPANSTITLTSQTNVGDFCVIDGSNSAGLIISGGNSTRLFEILGGGELVLKNLKLINGSASSNGGAFWNKGIVRLSNTTLEGNLNNGQPRAYTNTGNIYNYGIVTIKN